MLLRYFYDEKLAHASYLVGCQRTGEALVVDPGRNIDEYLRVVEKEGMQITAVTETHIHADFVSGARELADRTGARLYLSDEGDENWKYQYLDGYDHVLLKDGDTWKVGNIEFKALHTPGHTPEHMSFLITDTAGASKPMGVFTGDFIFVGDVGRPDLLESAAGFAGTKEVGARQLFQSLQKFRELPDYLQLWPAHGAGSACGKALGAVPTTTLGYEKMFNWAFSIEDEDQFVEAVLDGQKDPPVYFAMMKRINKEGPAVLRGLPVLPRLEVNRLAEIIDSKGWVIDTRTRAEASITHIPGTVNIPLTRSFGTYSGWVLPYDQPLYLIASEDRVEEAVEALIRIGYDNIEGYFTPETVAAWPEFSGKSFSVIEQQTPAMAKELITSGSVPVIDVRTRQEYEAGHPVNAIHIPLSQIGRNGHSKIDAERVVLTCQSGGRSFVAASMLQRAGVSAQLINLDGGYEAWTEAGLPIEK